MDAPSALLSAFASAFSQERRLFTLHFTDAALDGELLPHSVDGEEQLSAPYRLNIECLCSDVSLELKNLLGQGVDVAIQRSDGGERVLSGIVTAAQQLGADGGFARYGLTVEPALATLALRRNSRVFQGKSVVEIVGLILDEHIASNPVFAQCFRYRSALTATCAARSYCQQYRESDRAFIERLLREEGISYVFDFEHGADEVGLHTLVLFDSGTELAAAPQNTIRFHRADATEADDTLTDWTARRQIQPGAVALVSFNYSGVYTQSGIDASVIDHGEFGSGLIASLEDYDPQSLALVDKVQAGDSDGSVIARYASLRQQAHDQRSKYFSGSGVVRALGAGQWFTLEQHPAHEGDAIADRQFVVTRQRFSARNNLPGDFDGSPLVAAVAALALAPASNEPGYWNQIDAVRKSVAIVPDFGHGEYAKPTAPGIQTATVVGPAGEEIFTDALGRIKIQFHWARTQDHNAGTHGAGANRDDFSSCWVRVAYPSAGAQWGHQFIPRIGQEVLVDFIEGDIDRPLVIGALYNGQHSPPTFSEAGSLPANKTLSGIKSKEYKAHRYNELLFDDTTGEIRTKLSSEHGKTQLNQGYLIHPRSEGNGVPRGEGFELRTDHAGAVRAAYGLLLSTEPQPNAGGKQLDRHAASAQLDAAANLADQLGATAKAQNANLPETGKDNKAVNADSQSGAEKTSGHLHHLKDATANLERGSNTDADSKSGHGEQAGQQPLLVLSDHGGMAITTPQSATLASGSHIDQVAQRDLHQSSGKRWIHNAGESISLFVAGAQNKLKHTLKLIAAKGNVQMQAQSGEIEITADKNIALHAVKQNQTWSAQKEILITTGGAYVRISSGNIELHCPGTLTFKGSQHAVVGPASLSPQFPNLPQPEKQENWTELNFRDVGGLPMVGAPYAVKFENGTTIKGSLDARGHARLVGIPNEFYVVEYGEAQDAPQPRHQRSPNPFFGQAAPTTQSEAAARLAAFLAQDDAYLKENYFPDEIEAMQGTGSREAQTDRYNDYFMGGEDAEQLAASDYRTEHPEGGEVQS